MLFTCSSAVWGSGLAPHRREFRFLFILEGQARPGTHAIYLEDYALILTKIKNLSTHTKWLCASLVGAEVRK
jgi:hypothetical protein